MGSSLTLDGENLRTRSYNLTEFRDDFWDEGGETVDISDLEELLVAIEPVAAVRYQGFTKQGHREIKVRRSAAVRFQTDYNRLTPHAQHCTAPIPALTVFYPLLPGHERLSALPLATASDSIWGSALSFWSGAGTNSSPMCPAGLSVNCSNL
jgi:hypothetical protein